MSGQRSVARRTNSKPSGPRIHQPSAISVKECNQLGHFNADPRAVPWVCCRRMSAIIPAVFRAALALLVLTVSFEISGLGASFGDPKAAGDECPAIAAGGDCAPNCRLCACCSMPRVTPPVTFAVAAPEGEPADWLACPEMPAAPEPAGIMHVPRSVLA